LLFVEVVCCETVELGCQVTLMKQLSFLLHRSTDPGEANVIIESVLEDGSTGQ